MYNKFDNDRLEQINTMLMEFGSGDLTSRLERTGLNDDIEELTMLINMTVEKVGLFFNYDRYVNQNETYQYQVQSFFILDSKDFIVTFSPIVKKLLFFEDNELRAKPFYSFLTNQSKLDWNLLKFRLSKEKRREPFLEFIELSLMTKQDSILTMNCLVDKVLGGNRPSEKIIITSVEIEKDSEKRERELREKIINGRAKQNPWAKNKKERAHLTHLKSADIKKMRQVYEYIQENLDDPLPSLNKLAKSFETNEHRLKHGFKRLYGHTVYSFFMNERLNKAAHLVETSKIPLKIVAEITGFQHTSNFSRAFKKKYGHSPRNLRKRIPDDIRLTQKA